MNSFISVPRRQGFLALVVVALLALLVPLALHGADAQSSRSAYWKAYDTEITVNQDGSFHVAETQIVSFSGTFRNGTRVIPLDRMDSLTNIQVSVANGEGEQPRNLEESRTDIETEGTFYVSQSGNDATIRYYFEPTRGTEDRVIVIEYDVIGGLRAYPNEDPANQQLWWVAVSGDVTGSARVESATVTVHLPESVGTQETVWKPADGESDGRTWTWSRTDLASGSEFDIRLQFPPITSATVPSWQERDDAIRAEQEKQEGKNAVAGSIYLGAGLLLAVGGTLFFALRWYTSGRDPKTGLIADIISSPPDDLHPGAAGTLIDERTDTRDVVATLVDLGRRNIIRIDEEKSGGIAGFGARTEYQITLLDLDQPMETYERELLDVIFPGKLEVNARTPMSKANERMQRGASRIHGGFYQEVVDHGYFDERPDKVRARNGFTGIFALVVAAAVWFLVGVLYGGSSGFLWFMVFAAGFVYFVGTMLSGAMVRKTLEGAEAAAKWNAFKRYLEDIEKNADLEESQDIYERYLPYAVAFGIEKGWVNKFESAGAQTPDWFGGGGPVIITSSGEPYRTGRGGGGWIYGGSGVPGSDGGGSGGGWGIPDLQGSSDSAARGLGGASGSLLGMLGTAAKVLSDSSGGGGGFGGGGGGFSGGGGGGFGGGGGGGGSSSFG